MKTIFNTFREAAAEFCDGEKIHHAFDMHDADECIGWQNGVYAFAKYLDTLCVEAAIKQDDGDLKRLYWDQFEKARKKKPKAGKK